MAANDIRGWVMSGVSGVGECRRFELFEPSLIIHSLRPRFGNHLCRPRGAGVFPPQELPDRQQQ